MASMKKVYKDNPGHGSDGCVEDKPVYPYGLRIHLDNESLDKLGIKELPVVGVQMKLTALVGVVEVSVMERQEGEPERRMELQIMDMELTKPTEEKKDASEELYGVPRDKTKEGPTVSVPGF